MCKGLVAEVIVFAGGWVRGGFKALLEIYGFFSSRWVQVCVWFKGGRPYEKKDFFAFLCSGVFW